MTPTHGPEEYTPRVVETVELTEAIYDAIDRHGPGDLGHQESRDLAGSVAREIEHLTAAPAVSEAQIAYETLRKVWLKIDQQYLDGILVSKEAIMQDINQWAKEYK